MEVPPKEIRRRDLGPRGSLIQGLAERLQSEPKNLEGWLMLLRSYRVLGEEEKAAAAAGEALAAFEGSPGQQEMIRATISELGIRAE